jgi:hypothetical protein
MAVHYIEMPIDLPGLADREDQLNSLPGRHALDGEIKLGAFRGLAFALIFETVLFSLGGVLWALWHMLH